MLFLESITNIVGGFILSKFVIKLFEILYEFINHEIFICFCIFICYIFGIFLKEVYIHIENNYQGDEKRKVIVLVCSTLAGSILTIFLSYTS